MNVEGLQRRVETWIRDQTSRIPKLQLPPLPQIRWDRVKWPPWSTDRGHRKKLQEEYERRKKQLQDLCRALKAESVSDLQDILCCMVLSECVYKRPATELIRAVNKFKADFGGEVVCLERVQPSLDHVPHRYLLAEAGDTLFASFVGTKQYKDVVADANIFQGALFHEDGVEDMEDVGIAETADATNGRHENLETRMKALKAKSKHLNPKLKPAAHRGFMARAKGIPALELYRLAQKKKRKLVLCGHSLGGAVAALATLAILRVIAVSSPLKENEKFQVKCITFSQPPVGNAGLRNYVNKKGWQHYFKTYCIPEDLVPRFLSPAYFHHYNAQSSSFALDGGVTSVATNHGDEMEKLRDGKLKKNQGKKSKENGMEQLVLGVGPVQTPFWRLSRLVPVEGIRRHLTGQKGKPSSTKSASVSDSSASSSANYIDAPQSLEIEEGSDGVSLKPISESDEKASDSDILGKTLEKSGNNEGDGGSWGRVPYLPSYVPFGQLYLLGTSSVESLSDAEYSKLTSVKSVITELKERLQSHSMKSYRSRFQRIYDLCMSDSPAPFLGIEQLQQFPHVHQWLGLSVAGTVELGHIVESPSIRAATSVVPLGWNGTPGEKNADPLKVDITGSGLHLCTLVQAQVNGNWCSTTVETLPSAPAYSSSGEQQQELHKMRVLIGAPLRHSPNHPTADPLLPVFSSTNSDSMNFKAQILGTSPKSELVHPPGLSNFIIYCTTDFTSVSKEVDVRIRRVRLIGLEGAGKTSLFKAILNKGRRLTATDTENLLPEGDIQEGIAGGLWYMDSTGVNLQELSAEAVRLRDELWTGIRDLSKKIDLVVLVHNLAHQIPRYSDSNMSHRRPALSLLLDEAKALGIPWALAITNKFSVSAHQQRAAIDAVLKTYQASPTNSEIVNSCPYVIHTAGGSYASLSSVGALEDSDRGMGPQGFVLGPLNFVRRPFLRKATTLPVEGVDSFCQLVHRQLRSSEESSFEEFGRNRLLLELSQDGAKEAGGKMDAHDKANSISAATIGASLGAGIGVVLAVVMGAASALRKP